MGATLTERREGGARPLFAKSSDAEPGYRVRNLRLYEMPKAIAERHRARITGEAAQRMAVVRNEARRSPGGEYTETDISV